MTALTEQDVLVLTVARHIEGMPADGWREQVIRALSGVTETRFWQRFVAITHNKAPGFAEWDAGFYYRTRRGIDHRREARKLRNPRTGLRATG